MSFWICLAILANLNVNMDWEASIKVVCKQADVLEGIL